jgi:transcriptional regulator with XRE-family HTH domain
VDDVRVGVAVRALRRRRGWRQSDLAMHSGASQQAISLIERGHLGSLRTLRAVLTALEAQARIDVRWRGGELDRLIDERHAGLATATTGRLRRFSWEVAVEVTYSVYGERGSIDVIGWRSAERALLVVEVKSEITSGEATLRKHDEKVRLARLVVAERFGWQARSVSRLVVLPESRTSRRRIGAGGGLIALAYPTRGRDVQRWLRQPLGAVSGLLFLSPTNPRSTGRRIPRNVNLPTPDRDA